MDEIQKKTEEDFNKTWEGYRSFADLTADEQAKILAGGDIKEDPANPAILMLYMEQEKTWARVEKTRLFNIVWGKKDDKSANPA